MLSIVKQSFARFILTLHAEPLYAECRHPECHYHECRYAECRYAERHRTERRVVMLSVIITSIVMLSVIVLNVVSPLGGCLRLFQPLGRKKKFLTIKSPPKSRPGPLQKFSRRNVFFL